MDYTTQPLLFKVRKTARYARMYGPRRTLVKVQSQYHMKRRYGTLPVLPPRTDGDRHVGIIGCGNFSYTTIAFFLTRNFGAVIRGTMDIDSHHAASLADRYDAAYYTDDPERIAADPAIDLVYVASNHASHAEYAIAALDAGKSVHIEKPHVVDDDQLERLCSAMRRSPGRVGLGFNRPNSAIGQEIKRRLDAEEGPSMLNWFVAGHEIPADHWYYREEEGGRILGNLCHWTDFIFQMVPPDRRFPIEINPTRGAQRDCDIAVGYRFGDDSIGAITFSAKGHAFEGVKERFAAHRGNALITMDDFRTLTVDVVHEKHQLRSRFRDHGHEATICNSYRLARPEGAGVSGCSPEYVWQTGQLFLKTREALDHARPVVLEPFLPVA